MLVLLAGAVLGVVVTLVANQEPGNLLGFFIIVGSVAAVLGIQRGKIYLLFPVPALAFFVAAIAVGKVHDSKFGSSTIAVADGFTQWIAGIFFPAVVATALVLLIGGGRWLLGRPVVTGQFLLAQGAPPPRKPAAARRPAPARRPDRDDDPNRDSWADDNPFGDQVYKTEMMPTVRPESPPKPDRPDWMGGGGQPSGTGPRPRPGGQDPGTGPRPRPGDQPPGTGPRPRQNSQPPRAPRPDRGGDQWGDPRLQPPGSGPRPRQSGQQPRQDGQQPRQSGQQPRQDGQQPRQNGQQPRAPRPSFNPSQRPSRPPRPGPPEGWNR